MNENCLNAVKLRQYITYLWLRDLGEIRNNIVLDSIDGTGQGDASNQQGNQEAVGEQGRKVHHFSGPFDPLPDTEVADNPYDQ